MNKFFCEVGSKLIDEHTVTVKEEFLCASKSNVNSFYFFPITSYEIIKIINNMKNKAGGIDKISMQVLKKISPYIAAPLEHIFNRCLQNSEWPSALKEAEIIPIHKSGDKSNPNNYRPISLISNIAKIFEKIIHSNLIKFLLKNKVISTWQFGFLKNCGTKDALAYITDLIHNNIDTKKATIATFLDLKKAFDTVNHKILISKLEKCGVRGPALKLFENYLSDRLQTLKIGHHNSDKLLLKTGVPQGTILGPLLFLIYINDIFCLIKDGCILSYADDTTIISTANTWEEARNQMNLYLKTVSDWLSINKLTLNLSKTVYLTFGSYKNSIPKVLDIKVKDVPIMKADATKFLGVTIDSHLKWQHHIQTVIKRTKYLLFVFYKLASIMNTKTLLIIYHALFNSIASYGIIAWGGAYKNVLNPLLRLQKRILKIIFKNNIAPVITLKQTFIMDSMYHYYNDLKKQYITSHVITRNKGILIPKRKKLISSKNNKYIAIKFYNILPYELKKLSTYKKAWKRKITPWILKTTKATT